MAKVRVGPGLFSTNEHEDVRKCFLAIEYASRIVCFMDLAKRGREIEEISFESIKSICSSSDKDQNKLKNTILVTYIRLTDTSHQSFIISACSKEDKDRLIDELTAAMNSVN